MKGVPYEETPINLLRGDQHADSYKAVNPQAVVPSLAVDDGATLFQSMAILEYIDETHPRPPLLPSDARGRVCVRGAFDRAQPLKQPGVPAKPQR